MRQGDFHVQSAEITDNVMSNRKYAEGAFRVVDAAKGMKPAKVGKGGTVPFFGETAWSDAERLARDLWSARQYSR